MTIPLAVGLSMGASVVGGLLGRSAKRKEAKMQRQIADYNAQIIETNAKAEAANLETQRKRFTKQQRESFAQARMSVASRGGQYKGSDMAGLLEFARVQQLDQLEMVRKRDSALIAGRTRAAGTRYTGEVQAAVTRAEGDALLTAGILGAAKTYVGYKDWSPSGVSNSSRTSSILRQYGGSNLQKSFAYQDAAVGIYSTPNFIGSSNLNEFGQMYTR